MKRTRKTDQTDFKASCYTAQFIEAFVLHWICLCFFSVYVCVSQSYEGMPDDNGDEAEDQINCEYNKGQCMELAALNKPSSMNCQRLAFCI